MKDNTETIQSMLHFFSIGIRDGKDEGSLQEWIVINHVVNGTTLKPSSKNILCPSVPLLNE